VCFDAGKPESEYTSHWTRSLPDRNGKTTVVCPTLLNTECRYCFKLGHTTKYCPALEKSNKQKEFKARAEDEEKKKPKFEVKKKPTAAASFAALADSDSEEEDKPVMKINKQLNKIENFPVLSAPPACEMPKQVKSGWAAVVANTNGAKLAAETNEFVVPDGMVLLEKKSKKQVVETKVAPWVDKPAQKRSTWADLSDMSDDEEEDYTIEYIDAW